MVTDLDPIRSERDLLLAQGVRIAERAVVDAALFHPLGRDASVATVEFKINRPLVSNTLRNSDLHWFRGDAVKQLRFLFHRIREEGSARAVLLTAEAPGRSFRARTATSSLCYPTSRSPSSRPRPGDDEPDRGIPDPVV